MMGATSAVAMGFRYPDPDALGRLRSAAEDLGPGPTRSELFRFVMALARLSLGEWEELHTKTLDLSPLFIPYVGHVTWGENYRRGEFMAELKGAQRQAGVDPAGELPDHLEPILRYLDATDQPMADLVEVLPAAVDEMAKTLRKADAKNPYRHLLEAVRHSVGQTLALTEGVRT